MTLALFAALCLLAQDAAQSTEYSPTIEPASEEGAQALKSFTLAPGIEISLFAAEPMLANPVCLYAADDGSLYVAETFRHYAGVDDVRDHMDWLDDDLAARSVADRVAYLKKWNGEAFAKNYQVDSDRVRWLRDMDGDGTADVATVFADGFDDPAAGIGAGLLEHAGAVYFANIPDLWLLRDADGNQRAEIKQVLSHGYGVHIAYLGHDLHGLRIGPDGKLYFSCGDRGLRVETERGVVDNSHTGAVLRCNLDGSELEVFATGLRNPQELVFDEFGNLFTGDNNSDGGDAARFVHVVEASDQGWRYSYQHITEPNLRGPWNDELLWKPHSAGQAAYIVPPIDNVAHGPSGLTYYPGSGLSEAWRGRFFLVEFSGDPKSSGVLSFALEPQGSSFAVRGAVEEAIWGLCATDADFGPDGALYICDWVFGWRKTGKGRVYKVVASESKGSSALAEVRALFAADLRKKTQIELAGLLRHADQRLRLKVQLELVTRGAEGFEVLAEATRSRTSLFARLHGIWGIGCLARRDRSVLATIRPLLEDPNDEVRAQTARVLGDLRDEASRAGLITRLDDASERVQLFSAIAVARLAAREARTRLLARIAAVGERDATLRHALCYALANASSAGELEALAADPSIDVRVAAVVALRRQKSPLLARFVHDKEARVATEAARAIYDLGIGEALPALASRIELADFAAYANAFVRRVIHANFRSGGNDALAALARFAGREDVKPEWRAEALGLIASWTEPGNRDRFTGEWRPLPARDGAEVPRTVTTLEAAMHAAPDSVARAWIEGVRRFDVDACAATLCTWSADESKETSLRTAALEGIAELGAPNAIEFLKQRVLDRDGAIRAAAIAGLQKLAPGEALPILERALASTDPRELRAGYQGLARIADPAAAEILHAALLRLDAGLIAGEVALDLVLACEASKDAEIAALLESRKAAREALDLELAPYLDALAGGEPEAGKKLFREKTEIECLRCHRVDAGGEGGNVGPPLAGSGARHTRLSLVESIVAPNRKVARGFDTTIFVLRDETLLEGRVLAESAESIRLLKSDDTTVEIEPAEVEARRPGLSAMPAGAAKHLSRAQMRDLVAWLASL